jgi:hypothetical protein
MEWRQTTLRDYFAAQALAVLLASEATVAEARTIVGANKGVTEEGVIAHFAYAYADAMLAAREDSNG